MNYLYPLSLVIYKLPVNQMQYHQSKNYTQAFSCFEKVANQGIPQAQAMLSEMYYEGRGVSQNYQKAFYWIEKASNQQFAPAQFRLGMMYYNGQGVSQNFQKAFYWVEKSANKGFENAQLRKKPSLKMPNKP